MTDYRAQQLVLEPPQACETVVRLLKLRRRFAVEIDAALAKDAICIAVGGELVERTDAYDYAPDLTARTFDDAAQFAVNCIHEELCYDCRAIQLSGGTVEWQFKVERHKRYREARERSR